LDPISDAILGAVPSWLFGYRDAIVEVEISGLFNGKGKVVKTKEGIETSHLS
jgi:hypothetical protein